MVTVTLVQSFTVGRTIEPPVINLYNATAADCICLTIYIYIYIPVAHSRSWRTSKTILVLFIKAAVLIEFPADFMSLSNPPFDYRWLHVVIFGGELSGRHTLIACAPRYAKAHQKIEHQAHNSRKRAIKYSSTGAAVSNTKLASHR